MQSNIGSDVTVRGRTDPRPPRSAVAADRGAIVAGLMFEVAQCFFKIRALGQKEGFITAWGGGAFGFMRSLAQLGPLTVPQIAQMRPTSRQRMQRLADDLAAEGLVEFVDNPKHLRSKLVRLTPKGSRRFKALEARLATIGAGLVGPCTEAELRKAVEIVRQLGADVAARSTLGHE